MSSQAPEPDGSLIDHHVYDGIQEYDNPLPGWWTNLFWATILFSIVYLVAGWTNPQLVNTRQTYESAVTRQLEEQFATLGQLEPDEATLMGFLTDEEQSKWLMVGEAIFRTHCVSCHGRDGAGLSGPNLTDEHYKHVETVGDIPRIVTEGANKGAMPAWGNRLMTNEIVLVSSYVASLRGQNLPSARPAEGDVIEPWSSAP
jgi:cytochrome c oxidase cbb3-type subunit 3